MKVALAGNPNVGKSVVFNYLTHGRAWVGNWPGVTVEKKVGKAKVDGFELEVVDLPGIYGLTAHTVDELIARDYIVKERPDLVVNVVNAASLERNLYLTLSLLEMGIPLVVDLNMVDLTESRGVRVDPAKLSAELSVPVVATVASRRIGMEELKRAIAEALRKRVKAKRVVDYGPRVEEAVAKLQSLLEEVEGLKELFNSRWAAIKLLEGDKAVEEELASRPRGPEAVSLAKELRASLEAELGVDLESWIVERRYEAASRIAEASILKVAPKAVTFTDLLDSVVTHKVLGVPLALTVFYLMFQFAFAVSAPLSTLIDWFFGEVLYGLVASASLPEAVRSFLADGVVTGLGAVLVFLPPIAFLFLAVSALEDVGYMARAAFVVDKAMSKFKLSGRSIIPFILGLGCNVPAIMAARPIEDENDRKTTVLVAPCISCSARLPVYAVVAGAFFAGYEGSAILAMYVIGIIAALVIASVFRRTLFKGPSAGFVMELPPYMVPTLTSVLVKTWERTKRFLFKAGTVILFGAVLVWVLSVTGPSGFLGPAALEDPVLLEQSWVGRLGHFLELVFKPMGWDWRAAAALFFGFVAKEVVVGTLAILHGVSEEGLSAALASSFTPASALAYMVFVLLYVPCLATVAIIKGELGWRYAALAVAYELALAYVAALIVVGLGWLVGVA